jgi:hypothetical protein
MPILPIGSKHKFRTMPSDGAGDQPPIFGRVDQSTIREVERLASTCAQELRGGDGFLVALLESPSRSHFAVSQVHDREGSP